MNNTSAKFAETVTNDDIRNLSIKIGLFISKLYRKNKGKLPSNEPLMIGTSGSTFAPGKSIFWDVIPSALFGDRTIPGLTGEHPQIKAKDIEISRIDGKKTYKIKPEELQQYKHTDERGSFRPWSRTFGKVLNDERLITVFSANATFVSKLNDHCYPCNHLRNDSKEGPTYRDLGDIIILSKTSYWTSGKNDNFHLDRAFDLEIEFTTTNNTDFHEPWEHDVTLRAPNTSPFAPFVKSFN